jgi:hypothetical protein
MGLPSTRPSLTRMRVPSSPISWVYYDVGDHVDEHLEHRRDRVATAKPRLGDIRCVEDHVVGEQRNQPVQIAICQRLPVGVRFHGHSSHWSRSGGA